MNYEHKVAVICHVHPSISKGGAETAAYSLFTGLLSLGMDAIFIAQCNMADRPRLCLGSRREFVIYTEASQYEHFYHLGDPSVADRLIALLVREKAVYINFHHYLNFGVNVLRRMTSLQPSVFATALPPKFILTLHEFTAICNHFGQMVKRPSRTLCSAASPQRCFACFPEHTPEQFEKRREVILGALKGLNGYISPSRFLAQRMTDWGLDQDKIVIVENGLSGASIVKGHQPPHGESMPYVFGYFGQITPFKGVDTLLDAVDLIAQRDTLKSRVEIRIHGNMVAQETAFLERVDLSVNEHRFLTYSGSYENEDVATLMSDCDYVIVPSIWWENSPVVIQEAYSAGCPVICSGIGGMAEKVIDGVTGLHFKVRNAAHLAYMIEKATDPQLHATLMKGLPAVYDSTEMARRYLAAFDTFEDRVVEIS